METLLTGFEPWAGERRNPSGEVAAELGGVVLPVDFDRAERELVRRIRVDRPDLIVMLGLAPGRRAIELESVALNVDHCEDKAYRRWRRPIREGPTLLETRLPVDRLHETLRRAGIPVRISHHAGTFVCNHVFYVALAESSVPCGFVHVPPFSAVSRPRQIRAAELILETLRRGSRGSTPSAPPRARSRRGSRR